MSEKVELKISQLLEDLENGLTRGDIAEKYDLTKTAVANIFKHPQLKGKKTKKPKDAAYNLIDDVTEKETPIEKMETKTEERGGIQVEEVAEEVKEETPQQEPETKQKTWGD